jgi:hypothetical protein
VSLGEEFTAEAQSTPSRRATPGAGGEDAPRRMVVMPGAKITARAHREGACTKYTSPTKWERSAHRVRRVRAVQAAPPSPGTAARGVRLGVSIAHNVGPADAPMRCVNAVARKRRERTIAKLWLILTPMGRRPSMTLLAWRHDREALLLASRFTRLLRASAVNLLSVAEPRVCGLTCVAQRRHVCLS